MDSIDSPLSYTAMELYRQQVERRNIEARIKRLLLIEESIKKQSRLEMMALEIESMRNNRYSQGLSIETPQLPEITHDLLKQHEHDLLSKISLDSAPIHNIDQPMGNKRFSLPQAGVNGKVESQLPSQHWNYSSQTGNPIHISQIQRNAQGTRRDANEDACIRFPSSPPMHHEETALRPPPFLKIDPRKEDILNYSELLSQKIQKKGLWKKVSKPQSKNDLEFDVASTLCNLSSVQPKISEQSIETNSQGSADALSSVSQAVDDYPTRLSMFNDESELNSLHCFVRQELLEIFYIDDDTMPICSYIGSIEDESDRDSTSDNTASILPRNITGMTTPMDTNKSDSCKRGKRVGFRCVHCAHLHPRRARVSTKDDGYSIVLDPESVLQNPNSPMNLFYPKSLSELYRLVCKWQRVHFKGCRHVPPSVKRMYHHLKVTDKTRGKTKYWISSALELGLVDDDKPRGGIRYDPSKSMCS